VWIINIFIDEWQKVCHTSRKPLPYLSKYKTVNLLNLSSWWNNSVTLHFAYCSPPACLCWVNYTMLSYNKTKYDNATFTKNIWIFCTNCEKCCFLHFYVHVNIISSVLKELKGIEFEACISEYSSFKNYAFTVYMDYEYVMTVFGNIIVDNVIICLTYEGVYRSFQTESVME
jgi:hypothetical protein